MSRRVPPPACARQSNRRLRRLPLPEFSFSAFLVSLLQIVVRMLSRWQVCVVAEIAAAPVEHGRDHHTKIPTAFGQEVFVTRRMLAVPATFQQAGIDQRLQS